MNNLKKIGVSALAGSLVAVAANAGELSVSGSANLTYTNEDLLTRLQLQVTRQVTHLVQHQMYHLVDLVM